MLLILRSYFFDHCRQTVAANVISTFPLENSLKVQWVKLRNRGRLGLVDFEQRLASTILEDLPAVVVVLLLHVRLDPAAQSGHLDVLNDVAQRLCCDLAVLRGEFAHPLRILQQTLRGALDALLQAIHQRTQGARLVDVG